MSFVAPKKEKSDKDEVDLFVGNGDKIKRSELETLS